MNAMSDQPVSRDWVEFADRRGARAVEDGEPTRWFEEIWSAGARDEIEVPWDRDSAYAPVLDFVDATGAGEGRRAVVVGAGLGADAELLAARGFSTVAFDIAPSAVELARRRHPDSAVSYRVADLLDLPDELIGAFDLVIEVFTVQAMPRALRPDAVAGIRRLLAPGGEALVIQFVRPDGAADEGPPWLLDRSEMESFAGDDVHLIRLGTRPHPSRPEGPAALGRGAETLVTAGDPESTWMTPRAVPLGCSQTPDGRHHDNNCCWTASEQPDRSLASIGLLCVRG